MQKFSLDNELNRIQNKSIKKNSIFNKQRIPFYILVLLVVMTFYLNQSYSVDLVYVTEGDSHTIHVDVLNGYESSYDIKTDQPSFKQVIDSDYTNVELSCDNDNVKYDTKSRLLYGNSINGNVKCTLIFDESSRKSTIDFSKLYTVNDNNGVSYYYASNATNNYISINYLLFRIIRVNGDGSLRIILNDSIENSTYGEADYNSSTALAIANNWFNNNFANYASIVENDFDIRNYDGLGEAFDNDLLDFDSLYFAKVGFISATELMIINGSNIIDGNSYLYGNYFTSNGTIYGSVWAVRDGVVSTTSKSNRLGIRPVINVRYGSLKGDGTINNPYMIEE